MSLSNYAESALNTWLLTGGAVTRPTAWYVGIGTSASETGLTGEPVGNGYARQPVTMSAAGSSANANALTFGPCTGADWGSMAVLGIYDAPAGGNLLWSAPLAEARTIQVGDSLTFAVGAITATLD